MEIILVVFLVSAILAIVFDFFYFLFKKKRYFELKWQLVIDGFLLVIVPLIYFIVLDEPTNNCCSDSATFSPDHKPTIYIYVLICVVAYFYSLFKTEFISPIQEVLLLVIFIFGILLNCLIAYHIGNFLWVIGNLPIILLFLLQIIRRQYIFFNYFQTNQEVASDFFWLILKSNWFVKYPILMVLTLPFVSIVSSLLMLFGQKPDSLVKAFTDTYKHGFSELDFLCENVHCGGHYLCSVAANGHKNIVKPIRYGQRGGKLIICNRQLLISNAFEELIEEKFPKLHFKIRSNYNKVGNLVHKYYGVFSIKYVSDVVYFLMKPLEWFFLIVLYFSDQNPENRISRQYTQKR